MNKILYFLIIMTLFVPSFYAKEPTLAILRAVYSNASQKFSISNYSFMCKPYGVVTIDELYAISKPDSSCKKSIDKFYRQNPKSKFYTHLLFKKRQTYHVEFKSSRCLVYAKGLNTLSELLLGEGLAFKKKKFKDIEFDYMFSEAVLRAKENGYGLYKSKIESECIEELSAIEN